MSLSGLKRHAVAGALLASCAAAAPAGAAQTSSADLQCRFPVAGVKTVHLDISTDLPTVAFGSNYFGAITNRAVTVTASIPGYPDGIPGVPGSVAKLALGVDLQTVNHSLNTDGSYAYSDPVKTDALTGETTSAALVTSGPIDVATAGSLTGPPYGGVAGTLSGATLRERVYDADGTQLSLPPVATDVDGSPWTGPAGSIPCKLAAPPSGEVWHIKLRDFAPPWNGATNKSVEQVGGTSAVLTWTRGSWQFGTFFDDYDEYVITVSAAGEATRTFHLPRTASSLALTGLTPETAYSWSISGHQIENARDADQTFYSLSGTSSFTTLTGGQPPLPNWTTAGTLSLARGSGALTGTLKNLDLGAPSSSAGTATFAPTVVRLSYYGLPIVAAVKLLPYPSASSTFAGGTTTVHQDVLLQVVQARLLGSYALVSGTSCFTANPIHLALSGTVGPTGGTLSGPLTVGSLAGCGQWTSVLNGIFPGKGKVSLNLTPATPTPAPAT